MKILYVVHQTLANENSGTPVVADQYAREAVKKGYQVAILAPELKDQEEARVRLDENIYYVSVNMFKNWSLEAFTKDNNSKIQKLDLPFLPDIIHIIDWVNISPKILGYLASLKKPIIRHFCNFEDLCFYHHPFHKNKDFSLCQNEITPSMCSSCITEKTFKGQKFLKKIKSILFIEKFRNKKKFSNYLKDRREVLNTHLRSFYTHFIFPSKAFSKFFFSHHKIEKKYDVIHHGINKDMSKNIVKTNDFKKINFLYTGGRSERKGWKIIEESFFYLLKKYETKINLRIYGHKKKLIKSKLKDFKNVEFFDSYNYNDLKKILFWADVGILPSFFETYGLMAREYIFNKIIPVSSNSFGAEEIIINDKNGIILSSNTKTEVINKIENLINNEDYFNKIKNNLSSTNIISISQEFEYIDKVYKTYVK